MTAISQVLEKLVGQFDSVRQSRLFNDLALEQGTNSILYVAHSRHARQAIKPTYSFRKAPVLLIRPPYHQSGAWTRLV
jgi:hypothetical protein